MSHKCFISFKKEDATYKDEIVKKLRREDVIVKSLDRWIDSEDDDYIMSQIRKDYLGDSTVTVFIVGEHSSELEGEDELNRDKNHFIKRELQASLYNGEPPNTRNGILGVVLPAVQERIFKGLYTCSKCGKEHRYVHVGDDVLIREFSQNYYIVPHEGCAWTAEDRYCVLVRYEDFIEDPDKYINEAYDKRSLSIASKVTVRLSR